MNDPIVARIARDAGVPDLVERLADRLAPADLHSLLLAVARRRATRLSPADVLHRYREDRLGRPATISPELIDDVERTALRLLPNHFERLDLSPICPLGTSSVLARVSQDWSVATARGGEVVSDPTTVLALECALRRHRDRSATVRLATSMRVLRAQPTKPPATPHFRLLALCSAGRASEEAALLDEHLGFYVQLLERLEAGPIAVDREPRTRAYYVDGTFGISLGGQEVVEGGYVDWTQILLGDRKERLLISGIGTEFAARIVTSTRR